MGVHLQKFFQNVNLDAFFHTKLLAGTFTVIFKGLSASSSTLEFWERCDFDGSRGSGLFFRRSMMSFAFLNAHSDWLIWVVLHFVVTGNDQRPYLTPAPPPSAAFARFQIQNTLFPRVIGNSAPSLGSRPTIKLAAASCPTIDKLQCTFDQDRWERY